MALSGDGQVALIGAPAAAGGGAAYLYVESGGTWPSAPTATFTGPPSSQGEVGTSVALSANGEVALVGGPGGGYAPSNDGAAYLYAESAGTWPSTPTATFAGAPGSGGKLGSAVALSAEGTVALVGAPVASYGAAYLYLAQGGDWSSMPAATFTGPPSTDGGGEFGSSVALSASGQVALVGAPGAGSSYDGAGYLYSESGATWPSSPTAFFPGPPGAGAEDGNSVALSANGQVALLGAPEGAVPGWGGLRLYRVRWDLACSACRVLPRPDGVGCLARSICGPVCQRAGRSPGCTHRRRRRGLHVQ